MTASAGLPAPAPSAARRNSTRRNPAGATDSTHSMKPAHRATPCGNASATFWSIRLAANFAPWVCSSVIAMRICRSAFPTARRRCPTILRPIILRRGRAGGRRTPGLAKGSRSVLDLFRRGFTLLCFGDAADGERSKARRNADLPLAIVQIDDRAIGNAYERKLVLVRPDGHVAWRSDAPPREVDALLDACHRLLSPAFSSPAF